MFTLIQLPYAMEALEPVISAETISFHHGKHLQAYVDNLNKLLPGSDFEGLSLVEIVRQAPAGAIFNNAGNKDVAFGPCSWSCLDSRFSRRPCGRARRWATA